MGSAPIIGAEFDEPLLKKHRTEDPRDGVTVAERSHSQESSGSISSEVSEYDSAYIHSDSKGVVTIRQKRYPVYRWDQILWMEPKIISPMMIDENDMPYHIVSWDEAGGPLEPSHIETIVDDNIEPFKIILPEEVGDRPYSSCGRLTMLFPKSKEHKDSIAYSTYLGSGAAIDKNIVITAAHNILPSQFNHQPNVGRVKAEMIKFEHMLIAARVSTQGPVAAAKVSTHCFIHPEWEKNFDPRYDVALIFLSESLNLSDEDVDKLLKLKVHNGKEEMIRVVGHPKGWVDMRESEGKTRWEQPLASQEIIYHLANTLQGSSGSPIIADRQYIIGTHTRGASEATSGANSGVRMRKELLPFIEDSIAKHQAFLESMEALEALRAKERQDAEQALIDRGMAQGEAKGEKAAKVEIARNLKSMPSLTMEQIKVATGLTEEEINAL